MQVEKRFLLTSWVHRMLVYEGVRYQVKKEIKDDGKWNFKKLLPAKLTFTGEDVPTLSSDCVVIEKIQTIDFSEHPEAYRGEDEWPWLGGNTHHLRKFGKFKYDPTLDRSSLEHHVSIAYDQAVYTMYIVY